MTELPFLALFFPPSWINALVWSLRRESRHRNRVVMIRIPTTTIQTTTANQHQKTPTAI
jgi:hypothetical protein